MVEKLVEALNILNAVKVSGRDDLTRVLAAMQRIEEVARELDETKGE